MTDPTDTPATPFVQRLAQAAARATGTQQTTGTSTTSGTQPTQPTQNTPRVAPLTKPTMGDVLHLSSNESVAWTGGKPNVDWTGLDPKAIGIDTSPNQHRPATSRGAQQSYGVRTTGMEVKFTQGTSSLVSFQDEVWEHLKDSGMDTITYLVDPQDSTTTCSVIHEHANFTGNP